MKQKFKFHLNGNFPNSLIELDDSYMKGKTVIRIISWNKDSILITGIETKAELDYLTKRNKRLSVMIEDEHIKTLK